MAVTENQERVGFSSATWFDVARQQGWEIGLTSEEIVADLANVDGRRGVSKYSISSDYDAETKEALIGAVPECTELGRSFEASEGTTK